MSLVTNYFYLKALHLWPSAHSEQGLSELEDSPRAYYVHLPLVAHLKPYNSSKQWVKPPC